MIDDQPRCGVCGELVDDEGITKADCPVNPPATCEQCTACLCDGSC